MATQFETTGKIIRTGKDACIVSVTIDDDPKSYAFIKTIFYTFGVLCEGDMNNILEIDMEVCLCYKIPRPGGKPHICAVWLGEKPDDVADEDQDTLTPVYAFQGKVVKHLGDSLHVEFNDCLVLICTGNIFRDGVKLKDFSSIVLGNEVTFDAIPLAFEDVYLTGFKYAASCAWFGVTPSLVDRFGLRSTEETVKCVANDVICGTVVLIASDVVAFVEVDFEDVMDDQVMLFRSSLEVTCDRIQDVIDVGDRVCMRLGFSFPFPGRKQWFAVKAVKVSSEVDFDHVGDCLLEINSLFYVPDNEKSNFEVCPGDIVSPKHVEIENTMNDNVEMLTEFDKDFQVLYDDPPLSGVMSRTNAGAYITYGACKILVDPDSFYVDGKLHSVDSFMTSSTSDDVFFEAVSANFSGEHGACSHRTTCVWVGGKPTLRILAASLPSTNFALVEKHDQIFHGVVAKLCLPSVALVITHGDSTTVSIHVNSFVSKPRYESNGKAGKTLITDHVKLGDYVKFKVEKSSRVQHIVLGCDVETVLSSKDDWEEEEDTSSVCDSRDSREEPDNATLPDIKSPLVSDWREIVPSEDPAIKVTAELSTPAIKAGEVCVGSPLKRRWRWEGHSFLLNCEGTIRINENIVTVEHAFGSSPFHGNILFMDEDDVVDFQKAKGFQNRAVHFDAESVMEPISNNNFLIKRMWYRGDRIPSELVLMSELSQSKLVLSIGKSTVGKISKIPLHDSAIATVKGVSGVFVLVPFESLHVLGEVELGSSPIEEFLKVRDKVGLKIEKREFPRGRGGSYYRAVSCWLLSKGRRKMKSNDELQICDPQLSTWFSKWGLGEYFCTGHFDGLCSVTFTSRWNKSESTLNLVQRKVFVDGKPVGSDEIEDYHGKEISIHVGHNKLSKINGTFVPRQCFVACAWMGEVPKPEVLLKDELQVPKGLILLNRCHEVVVDSFPLPTHAICLLGYAPVLVPLQGKQSKDSTCVDDVDLKRGDRLLVTICEKEFDGSTVLVSTADVERVSGGEEKVVLRNMSGKIKKLPRPTGLIKAYDSKLTVSFELCHVRRTKLDLNDKEWFEGLSQSKYYGKVYFSAVKDSRKKAPAPYRAFEVYFNYR